MNIVVIVFLFVALASFIAAMFSSRINWLALGLIFCVLAWLIPLVA